MSSSPPASPLSQPDRESSPSSGVPFEISAAAVILSILTDVYRSLSGDFTVGFGRNWEHMALARSLVAGQGFANPFGEHLTGPTAAYAPIHPAMLGALLAVFGDRPSTLIPAVLLEAAIRAACLFLLLRISVRAFDSWMPGALASVVLIFGTRPEPQWEGASAWLAVEVVAFLLLARRSSIWSGAAMGLGWLVSPLAHPGLAGDGPVSSRTPGCRGGWGRRGTRRGAVDCPRRDGLSSACHRARQLRPGTSDFQQRSGGSERG